jgi:hypothetical protein
MKSTRILASTIGLLLAAAAFMFTRAQDPVEQGAVAIDKPELPVSDPSCTFFGPQREKFLQSVRPFAKAELTAQVASMLPPMKMSYEAADATATLPSAPGGSRTDRDARLRSASNGTIDKYIFDAINAAGVAPAPATTDFEFVRRAYLDLTGRVPTSAQVLGFVNDANPSKRSALVDQLVGSPEYIDKWTMWFGDLLKNNSRNTQIPRFVPGVLAFNNFIRDSLKANKPYDQMAREMIAAQGGDSFVKGELNFVVGGVMAGGPIQDVFDEQIATTVETFLGVSHLECLLCHNGRGHLDQLSLWGYYSSRQQAWGMASFMSHTATTRTPVDGAVAGNPYYWNLINDQQFPVGTLGGRYNFRNDYPLNTQTGNRPPRGAPLTGAAADPTNNLPATPRVKPSYIFDNSSPAPGSDYRAFLAQKITSDFQFARATVNYMWEYFFGVGLVSPSNQFDPERLDPDHPPTDCPGSTPCTLQGSNPRLLNALAQDFINAKFDIRALQKQIVNSRAYQLSSRYEGTWSSTNQNLFARKLVRRLWAEEIHDSVALSSNVVPTYAGTYALPGSSGAWGPVNWAMKFPEPFNTPTGAAQNAPANATFLDAFLRGNRDDESRKPEGSIAQALGLMNDNFIMARVRSNDANSLIRRALAIPDDQLVDTLYLTVLSRYPTSTEKTAALANLKPPNNRTTEAQNLLWSLYNSVSFVFNY